MQHINANAHAGSASCHGPVFPASDFDLDYTRLDHRADRYQLLLLVKRVGKAGGFTPRMIQLLDYYIAYTTAVDWEEGSRPIVFQSVGRTALDLGVTERQIQKLEAQLFALGAIAWRDSGNHKRFGQRNKKTGRLAYAFGVDLTPLAYLREQLAAALQQKQRYAADWQATKREISSCRRIIRDQLQNARSVGVAAEIIQEWERRYDVIAYQLRSHIPLEALQELSRRHRALCEETAAATEVASDGPSHRTTTGSAAATRTLSSEKKFAHKQHTIQIKKTDRTEAEKGLPGEHGDAWVPERESREPSPPTASFDHSLLYSKSRWRQRAAMWHGPANWSNAIEKPCAMNAEGWHSSQNITDVEESPSRPVAPQLALIPWPAMPPVRRGLDESGRY